MSEPFVPIQLGSPRLARPLTALGVLLAVVGLALVGGVGIPAFVRTVTSFDDVVGGQSYAVPVDHVFALKAHRYSVYLNDPANPGGPHAGSTGPVTVRITAMGSDEPLTTRGIGLTESLDHDGEVYQRATDFSVARAGNYRVQVEGRPGARIVVARGLAGATDPFTPAVLAGYLGAIALTHGLFLVGIAIPMRRRRGDGSTTVPSVTITAAPEADSRPTVVLTAGAPSFDDVVSVARHGAQVRIEDGARDRMRAARRSVEILGAGEKPIYGVSTGFGALANTRISTDARALLQQALVRSHAAGSGPEVEREVVRALMLLRMHTFVTGHTGVRESTAEAYAHMLNAGITPVVREYGSLGCSGDLAPLATCALAITGEGEVRDASGVLMPALSALTAAGIEPVALEAKEGLALINGTDGMLGMLVLALADLARLMKVADISAAMSVEGLLGTDRVFAADIQALRPHPGQASSATNLRALLAGSAIMESHRGEDCSVVQDAYSLRCAPQVAGAARDTAAYAAAVANRELASSVDNPAVLSDYRIESNGNFHGAPVAYVLDFLAIAVADLASISERRTDRMLDPSRSHGLPAFLAGDPGVDSGLMIAQYTQAAVVSELKRLANPASVDSIPSSAMQEDHVSMGWSAGRKLRRSVDGLTRVLAVEIMAAARALDLRGPLSPSPASAAVIARLRETVPGPGPDRWLTPEIEAAVAAVADGSVLAAAEAVTGPLA